MQIRFVLAIALVALVALPATSGQLLARNALSTPLLAPAGIATAGLFSDPNSAPTLSIELPKTVFSSAL